MKTVHDQNLSFWSPQPYFIGAFFFPQQIIQLVWLYKLWKGQGTKEELAEMTDYVAIYASGNACIGSWSRAVCCSPPLKHTQLYKGAEADWTLPTLAYVATRLRRMNTAFQNFILTHIAAKTFAGIGILDFLHNTSSAYFVGEGPSTWVKALTGVGFAAAVVTSDWILGSCLVYHLVALTCGQEGSWRALLAAYAAGTAAIVGVKNWVK
ncbi:hypothetical protein H2201_004560 [Coniosporium apollinis]|uniref:Uncharacterized protein n=1 Tax=Coniosporium apollinis TaxID=61459 RepID=A0ABQ9NVH9_9PEZI|nr:hypothetical protein H2201_004560 [Coniosporium apollinis]